jgi:hypothetical protein
MCIYGVSACTHTVIHVNLGGLAEGDGQRARALECRQHRLYIVYIRVYIWCTRVYERCIYEYAWYVRIYIWCIHVYMWCLHTWCTYLGGLTEGDGQRARALDSRQHRMHHISTCLQIVCIRV